MNENTAFEKQLEELRALQPQPITFKGKVRKVHFFRQGRQRVLTESWKRPLRVTQ